MGITVSWDDSNSTIIRYDLTGLWNWDDYFTAVEASAKMMESVNHPVGIIANFRADTMVPHNPTVRTPEVIPQDRKPMPRNLGLIVVTGGAGFLEVMLVGFCRAYHRVGKRFLVAGSLDDARALILERLRGSGAAQA